MDFIDDFNDIDIDLSDSTELKVYKEKGIMDKPTSKPSGVTFFDVVRAMAKEELCKGLSKYTYTVKGMIDYSYQATSDLLWVCVDSGVELEYIASLDLFLYDNNGSKEEYKFSSKEIDSSYWRYVDNKEVYYGK